MIKKAAIIIPNWNGLKLLEICLPTIFQQTYSNLSVFIVDNASTDGSCQFIKKNYEQVNLIELTENCGFAKATNIGIKQALNNKKIHYLICLNNDTILDEKWLESLIKTAEEDEKIGAVGSKSYFKNGYTIQNAGLIFSKSLQTTEAGGISLGYGKTDEEVPSLSRNVKIFAPGGVAALYKRKVVEEIMRRDGEFFDEDFFAYVEDLDIGFRIGQIGYVSLLAANARLVHLHSQTGIKASSFKSFYIMRNSLLTALKNFKLVDLFLYPLRSLVVKFKLFLKPTPSLKKFKKSYGFNNLLIVNFKALASALFLLPKFIKKRCLTTNRNFYEKSTIN